MSRDPRPPDSRPAPRVLAVIQARGGSKGIPGKNIAPVAGHPLLAYSVDAGLRAELVTELVVSTDAEEIADVARSYGAEVPFLRPPELATDTMISMTSLRWAVMEMEELRGRPYDYVVELPCVSPLRGPDDIDGALRKLMETGVDSVISMADTGEKHPIRLKRIVDDRIVDFTAEYPEPPQGSRRQDLKPPSYIRNGAIYAMTRDCIVEKESRHGEDSRPWIMPAERSVNADEPLDLKLAEFFILEGFCPNRPRKVGGGREAVRLESGKDHTLLVTTNLGFIPDMLDEMAGAADVIYRYPATRREAMALLPEADAWITSPAPDYVLDAGILDAAAGLRVLVTPSTGTNHIDLEACRERGIEVRSLRGTDFVASITASSEFTFTLVLALVRKLPRAVDTAKRGFWRDAEDALRGIELAGRTLGVIGYGRIGANVSRYARAMGMEVLAHDPYVEIPELEGLRAAAGWEEVLESSDVVVVCVHLDESTRGMVDASWFRRMREDAYFVNTSRGEVVDEEALLEALRAGRPKAAAVDVISDELTSEKREHPLIRYAREHDNLLVTPHIAGLTYDSERKAARYAVAAVRDALDIS